MLEDMREHMEKEKKLMDAIINLLPDGIEVRVVKSYRSVVGNIMTIFKDATDNIENEQIQKETLQFFMQLEALTSQYMKNREEK